MKKIIKIFVLILLIATAVSPVVNCIKNENKLFDRDIIDNSTSTFFFDELDQYQNQSDFICCLYQVNNYGKYVFMQSFKPSYPTLTRVSFLLRRVYDPFLENGKLQVVIKSELDPGHWITSVDLTESDIPLGENWIDVDIDDIHVEPERTYYLLLKPLNIFNFDSMLFWSASDTSPTDLYTRGDAYFNDGDPDEFRFFFMRVIKLICVLKHMEYQIHHQTIQYATMNEIMMNSL